ncbi:MAG: hypothetical protein AAGE80_18325 [Pseudomonadota bacterium]
MPRPLVERIGGSKGIWIASIATCIVGAAVIYAGAYGAEALGIADAKTEIDRGINAWKIMLLVAPASAMHRRRQIARGG